MKEEMTLLILKPDCVAKGLSGEVIRRIEQAGFVLRALKMQYLDRQLLQEHYAHLRDKPFFEQILDFMTSGPVILAVFSGENVVTKVREMVGPTDSRKAPKGTVRGDFGVDVMVNVVHASDSVESAQAELNRFFDPHEICELGNPVQCSGR